MKSQRTTKSMIIASIILLAGVTIAFAHGGWGGGNGPHMNGDGPGWGKRGSFGDLSEEETAKIEEARENFFADTKEIRSKMNELREDLRDEMIKDDPDSAKVLEIQKELSSIKADFDQMRIQHRLEMRKLVPEKFKEGGFGRGKGRGYGRGGGRCWE